jgi:hypothetical protein
LRDSVPGSSHSEHLEKIRILQIKCLLETENEPYEGSASRSTLYRESSLPSKKRRRFHNCGHCAGAGCEHCEAARKSAALEGRYVAKGRVELVEHDAYDDHEKGFSTEKKVETMSPKQLKRALDVLRENDLKRAGVYAEHVDFAGPLRKAEQRDSSGSYRELRWARERMPIDLRHALRRARDPRRDAAIRWLEQRMPHPIHIPHWTWRERREKFAPLVQGLFDHHGRHSDVKRAIGIPKHQLEKMLEIMRAA